MTAALRFMVHGIRLGLYIAYVFSMAVLFIFKGEKYDWMSDFDPSLAKCAIVDESGIMEFGRGFFLAVTLIIVAIILMLARRTYQKAIVIGLFVAAVLMYFYVSSYC